MKKTSFFICLVMLPVLLFAQQGPATDTPVSIHGFGGKLTLTGSVACLILLETRIINI